MPSQWILQKNLKNINFLRDEDFMVMNRDRLIAEADKKIAFVRGSYSSPQESIFNLPGSSVMSVMTNILEKLFEAKKN